MTCPESLFADLHQKYDLSRYPVYLAKFAIRVLECVLPTLPPECGPAIKRAKIYWSGGNVTESEIGRRRLYIDSLIDRCNEPSKQSDFFDECLGYRLTMFVLIIAICFVNSRWGIFALGCP